MAKFFDFVIYSESILRDPFHFCFSKVQVLYGGNEIYDYEVDTGFWTDMRLATISLASISVLMLLLTSFSVWLTVCGLVSIVVSFPMALVLYRTVFGIQSLGILNGAAAFVIVGIGQYSTNHRPVFHHRSVFHQS